MKVLKTLLRVTLALVAVVVTALGILLATFDINDYKDQLITRIKSHTGRDLVLDGPLELGLWPKISLRSGPLTLSNVGTAEAQPLLRAERIQIAVATWPLLRKRVEMDTVVLHGVHLNLRRDAAGIGNWADLVNSDAGQQERQTQHQKRAPLAALILGGVDIKGGRVTWHDAATGQEFTLSNVTASTDALTFGKPMALTIAATARANQPALDTDITLTGTLNYNVDDQHYVLAPLVIVSELRGAQLPGGTARLELGAGLELDLKAGTAQLSGLKLDGLGTSLRGEFSAHNIEDARPSANGQLQIKGRDLAALFEAFALPAGKQLAHLADRSFSFNLDFDANMDSGDVKLTQFDGQLLGASLSGHFDASKANTEQPAFKGEMKARGADLPAVLVVAAALQGRDSFLAAIAQSAARDSHKQFSFESSFDADFKAETANLSRLTLSGLGLTVQANIAAEQILSKPAYHGSLHIPRFNLRKLLKALNQPVPKTADTQALRAVALKTHFAGNTTGLTLDALQVTLDDSQMTGDINVAAFSGPQLIFSLAVDGIDADRYLKAPAKEHSGAIVTPDAAVAGAAHALPVEALRTLIVKGALSAGTLKISGAKLQNVRFNIDAAQGLVNFEPLAAQLYEGRYGGGVTLDARGKQTTLALKTRLDKVQIAPLLHDLKDIDSLAGMVSFDAALQAADGRAAQVKQSLDGTGRFGITAGVFRGVDAVAILRAAEQMIHCRCGVAVPKGGQTQFKNLDGTIAIKQGVVRNDDLVMNGEGFTIKGQGTLANLNDNSLKYDLLLAVSEQRTTGATHNGKLGGYQVPIACRGQVDNPTCLPDFGQLLGAVAKDAAKKKLEKAVGKKLQGVLDGKQGDALKNLLKF